MYLPAHFKEDRTPVLHDLIRAHPLAALVTLDADGLVANHIPMEIDAEAGELGTLRGHVARANPMWTSHRREVEAMAVFQSRRRSAVEGQRRTRVLHRRLLKAIVGIELPLTRMDGKWKVSQNRPPEDRAGVVAGLPRGDDPMHHAMAKLVRERG